MAKILNIRGVNEDVAKEFSIGANAREITQAEYLSRLLLLRTVANNLLRDANVTDHAAKLSNVMDTLNLWTAEV